MVLFAGLVTAFACEALPVMFGNNVHAVIPGRVYRSAQIAGKDLQDVVRRHHIRTVINLRGCCPEKGWYARECAELAELGIRQCDINFSNYTLPDRRQMSQFIKVLETCEYPILLHCRRGADRTGLAAAMILLLEDRVPMDEACQQLSWRFGHLPLLRQCELNDVLQMYQAWLVERGQLHRGNLFRKWVIEEYRPGKHWAEIEPLEVPARLRAGKREAARFRVYNRSSGAWQFKRSANSGVHLRYRVKSLDARYEATGGAGYFDAVVVPGESIDLVLALPAIRMPGRYELLVDMWDEERGWFLTAGSPPFETELEVEK